LRDYIICDELTGDFGNVLEATSAGDCGSFGQLREIDRMAFCEFCNSIGTWQTSAFRRMSALRQSGHSITLQKLTMGGPASIA
jgi:hypothetical protein